MKRGGLQGTCRFRGLSWNMAAEAIIKFVGAIVLIEMGFGVLGAVAAISASVIFAYLSARQRAASFAALPSPAQPAPVGEAVQAIVFFVGQVIISNIDILMVKHFFRPDVAGLVCRHRAGRTAAVLRRMVDRERHVPGIGGEQRRRQRAARCWRCRC